MIPTIAISMGDPNGIGPEVTLKSLQRTDLGNSIPVWIGSQNVFEYYSDKFDIQLPIKNFQKSDTLESGSVYLFDIFENSDFEITSGKISKKAGSLAMQAVEKGIELCMNGQANALTTASISKEAIHMAGYKVPGHTEFLAEKTGTDDVVMVLASDDLRVALATIHIPLKDVNRSIQKKKLKTNLQILYKSLREDFGIENPKIGVLGLNPHAGDGGVIGTEEIERITPALDELSDEEILVDGPFAADGYFGSQLYKIYDATFAMYHDQGLIPFKALTFGEGVNFTAGLPIIRTSPDHGTAFDIAGKNIADEQSFQSAYDLAVTMAQNRIRKS
ncbi:MAG: 4-hydroxythreonine-4-phosphate dehydrogenase PdxA [Balneolaceae bacterium]|nr:4-hydroxythreonine-4-phosphate dehydrogenase PdxA [Balneolaceae bacterium]